MDDGQKGIGLSAQMTTKALPLKSLHRIIFNILIQSEG